MSSRCVVRSNELTKNEELRTKSLFNIHYLQLTVFIAYRGKKKYFHQRIHFSIKHNNTDTMNRFIIVLLCAAVFHSVQAQPVIILKGLVLDSAAWQPLPSAILRVLNSSKGTATNAEGAFQLALEPGRQTIVASFIGYVSDTVSLFLTPEIPQHTFLLRPSVIPLPAIIAYAQERDPAEEIILKASQKKHAALSQLRTYRFRASTKTTVRAVSRKNTVDTIVACVFETQSEGYWKFPDLFKEILTARRQPKSLDRRLNTLTVGHLPNFNDDRVSLDKYSIVGPTAPDALEYYSFTMLDTVSIDNIPVYRIRMKPKSTNTPLFDGVISIASKSFMVMSVDLQPNEAMNLAPMEQYHIHQQFSRYDDIFWMPTNSTENCIMSAFIIEQTAQISDYILNKEISDSLFDQYAVTAIPEADKRDSAYWKSTDVIPLTTKEQGANRRLDSLLQSSFLSRTLLSLTQASVIWDDLPFTSFSDFLHFNRVEGLYVGAGIKIPADKIFSPSLCLGYGTSNAKWNYDAALEYQLPLRLPVFLGAGLYDRLKYREGDAYPVFFITECALFDYNDLVDYFHADGWRIFTRAEISYRMQCNLEYRFEQENSVKQTTNFSFDKYFSDDGPYRSNSAILDGNLRSISFGLKYDTRQFLAAGFSEEAEQNRNSWQLRFDAEHTDRGFLKSDFEFNRCTALLKRHQLISGEMCLDIDCSAGYSDGALPPQKMFDVISRSDVFEAGTAMRTALAKEFAGDRIAVVQIDYTVGSAPFRLLGIPAIKNTDLIFFTGCAWSDVSAESLALQTVPISTARQIYTEAGFGLGRIMGFLRIDCTWRVTQREHNCFYLSIETPAF